MKKIFLRVPEKATVRIRTENLLIKSQPLYHLSYDSLSIEREPRKNARCYIILGSRGDDKKPGIGLSRLCSESVSY